MKTSQSLVFKRFGDYVAMHSLNGMFPCACEHEAGDNNTEPRDFVHVCVHRFITIVNFGPMLRKELWVLLP